MCSAKQAWAPATGEQLNNLTELYNKGELDFKGSVFQIKFFDHPLKAGKNWVCLYGEQWYQTNIRRLPTADELVRAAAARPFGTCPFFGKFNFRLQMEFGEASRKAEKARVVSPK